MFYSHLVFFFFFFFNDTATTEIYTLSLHDALPISFPATVRESFRVSPRLSSTASVIARYSAPESRCAHPRRRATREAVELLPEAAGPSIAMTRRVTVSPFPFPLSRCDASRQKTEGS